MPDCNFCYGKGYFTTNPQNNWCPSEMRILTVCDRCDQYENDTEAASKVFDGYVPVRNDRILVLLKDEKTENPPKRGTPAGDEFIQRTIQRAMGTKAEPEKSDNREEIITNLIDALKGVLRRDEINTCCHEETYRGGAIWEICNMCGEKWADDKGGKPEWQDPPEWDKAYTAIKNARNYLEQQDDVYGLISNLSERVKALEKNEEIDINTTPPEFDQVTEGPF